LNNNSKVTVLISDLNAVIDQGLLDVPGNLFQKKYGNPDELQYNIEIKCNSFYIFSIFFYPLKPLPDVVKALACLFMASALLGITAFQ